VQQLLPVLGEGSSITVISSLGARTAVGKPGLENPSLLRTPPPKGPLKRWSKTGLRFSGQAVSASTPSRPASSTRTCQTSPRRKPDANPRSQCRR
jgi:hypothetical protein